MIRKNDSKHRSVEKRRARLRGQIARLEKLLARTAGHENNLEALYRRLSDLEPEGFVVVCGLGEVNVYGVSSAVGRGIVDNDFRFRLVTPITEPQYLSFGARSGERGMHVELNPGESARLSIGRGNVLFGCEVFFEAERRKAHAIARRERLRRGLWADGKKKGIRG